jgi:hypothetical protein
MPPEDALIAAHKRCAQHEREVMESSVCGCFHCLGTFQPVEIKDWVDDEPPTALCPRCGIDSVIGDASGFPVTDRAFMGAMNMYWFQRTVPSDGLFYTQKGSLKTKWAWLAVRDWFARLRR